MSKSTSKETGKQLPLPGINGSGSVRSKRKRRASAPVFKPYRQDQMLLLPPSLEELIPPNHLVRVINETVEKLNIEPLLQTYKGGGTSSYHPLMLLKVLLYAYVERIYGSRKIAKALRENVHFMWLSGMQFPDFRTINNFRSGRLKGHIDTIFASLMLHLVKAGYVDLKDYFVDGSKFMANANRHSHVWKKNVTRYRESVREAIKELLAQIDKVNEEENRRYGERDLPELGEGVDLDEESQKAMVGEINEEMEKLQKKAAGDADSSSVPESETMARRVDKIEKRLAKEESSDAIEKKRRIVKKIKGKLLPRLQRYEEQERILGRRGSYSKTDPDATFMRFKDGVLAPGYNILMGSQHQFILNYSVHQNPADTACFIEHLQKLWRLYARLPENVVGDSGFGSEENYGYLQNHGIGNYLKYNNFHNEEKRRKKHPYSKENFTRDAQEDVFICPEGRKLHFEEEEVKETASGYQRRIRRYRSRSCQGCAARPQCCRGEGERGVEFSPLLEEFKRQARENLESEKGKLLRRRRGVEIETIFAQLKFNRKYYRFLLRGLEKVNIELGLLSISHNIEKMFRTQLQLKAA